MTHHRLGTAADSRTCFNIFERTIDDLGQRTGGGANSTAGDPATWDIRRPLFDHLAATGDAWWIARDRSDCSDSRRPRSSCDRSGHFRQRGERGRGEIDRPWRSG
jgi:hypothetical protein